MRDIEFQRKIRKYIFKPFFVGDKSKGWDCLNSLRDFYESCGLEFPKEYKGWTWENYAERWNRGEGQLVLRDFACTLGSSVNVDYIQPGDIIVFVSNDTTSLGQYVGNGNFKAHHPEHGCVVLPLGFFKHSVYDVRRLTE